MQIRLGLTLICIQMQGLAMQWQFTNDEIVGQSDDHLASLQGGQKVHRSICQPLEKLQSAAGVAGFCLSIASGFRSFDRQLLIWNAKARGERPVLNTAGLPIDIQSLPDDWARVQAILRWSALPGCSRHHWGTDMDVFDANALPTDYSLQLTIEESATLFGDFHLWLDEQIATGNSYGFYRPYASDQGGIAPEPWHISYSPIAEQCESHLTPAYLKQVLTKTDLMLKAAVLENFDEIYQRYIVVPKA